MGSHKNCQKVSPFPKMAIKHGSVSIHIITPNRHTALQQRIAVTVGVSLFSPLFQRHRLIKLEQCSCHIVATL